MPRTRVTADSGDQTPKKKCRVNIDLALYSRVLNLVVSDDPPISIQGAPRPSTIIEASIKDWLQRIEQERKNAKKR